MEPLSFSLSLPSVLSLRNKGTYGWYAYEEEFVVVVVVVEVLAAVFSPGVVVVNTVGAVVLMLRLELRRDVYRV